VEGRESGAPRQPVRAVGGGGGGGGGGVGESDPELQKSGSRRDVGRNQSPAHVGDRSARVWIMCLRIMKLVNGHRHGGGGTTRVEMVEERRKMD
jgi:hypothetical protein